MATDLWAERDLPLLELIAEHDADGGPIENQDKLAKLTDLDQQQVEQSLDRLVSGGMATSVSSSMLTCIYDYHSRIRPTAEGRRAVGQWPGRDVAAGLLEAIERRIDEAETPEERGRWERARDNLKSLGISALASVILEAGKHAGGL